MQKYSKICILGLTRNFPASVVEGLHDMHAKIKKNQTISPSVWKSRFFHRIDRFWNPKLPGTHGIHANEATDLFGNTFWLQVSNEDIFEQSYWYFIAWTSSFLEKGIWVQLEKFKTVSGNKNCRNNSWSRLLQRFINISG